MWYIGEGMMYVDENGNSCELKYGDKVKITPCEENDTEYNRFKCELENLRTGKIVHMLESIENMLDEYTTDEYSVNEADIPEKPFKFDEGIFMCSNCGYIVCNDDTRCDNCMQVLDWEE